jgi:hypothetical protein
MRYMPLFGILRIISPLQQDVFTLRRQAGGSGLRHKALLLNRRNAAAAGMFHGSACKLLRACSISGKILGVHKAGGKIAKRFCAAAARRKGIAAEIPQDLHKQIRGIEAESPVFCGVSRKKCAQILLTC